MPGAAKPSLPPRNGGKESIWHRIACNRNEYGLTAVELAATLRIVRTFGAGYQIIRLHRTAKGDVRVAPAPDVTRNERLHTNAVKVTTCKPSRKCGTGRGKGRNLRPPGKRRSCAPSTRFSKSPPSGPCAARKQQ